MLEQIKQQILGTLQGLPDDVQESIRQGKTYGQCGNLTLACDNILRGELPVKKATSAYEDSTDHVYLVIEQERPTDDIITDATVSQHIKGHNEVFVGTREELRKLASGSTIINTHSKDNPQEAFERIWGSESLILY